MADCFILYYAPEKHDKNFSKYTIVVILNWSQFCPLGETWQRLERVLQLVKLLILLNNFTISFKNRHKQATHQNFTI